MAAINVKKENIFPYKQKNLSRVMRKPTFCICKNKDADQVREKLIRAFVFTNWIVQYL